MTGGSYPFRWLGDVAQRDARKRSKQQGLFTRSEGKALQGAKMARKSSEKPARRAVVSVSDAESLIAGSFGSS